MTVAEINTAIRTAFLGVLLAALLVLLFQVSAAVVTITQDVRAVTGEADALLERARWFVPQERLDMRAVNATVSHAGELLARGNRTLEEINAPCVPGPCGVLADAAKTLNTARMTMGQVEIAANHEDKNLATLDTQEAVIYAGANQNLQALHALLASPDLLQTLHNLDSTSAAVAHSAVEADGTLTDVRDEVHKLTHPSKKKIGFWGAILATGQTIQKLSPPLF